MTQSQPLKAEASSCGGTSCKGLPLHAEDQIPQQLAEDAEADLKPEQAVDLLLGWKMNNWK